MSDRLADMMQRQADFQRMVKPGIDLTQLSDSPELRAEKVREMVLACVAELFEALDEVGWKPWATSRHLNRPGYVKELIDAWHFFMNLLLIANIDPEEFYQGYLVKLETNIYRQLEDYDGVETKCPGCKRALDEPDAIVPEPHPGFPMSGVTTLYQCASCQHPLRYGQGMAIKKLLDTRKARDAGVSSSNTD